jgi:hypothetical protein
MSRCTGAGKGAGRTTRRLRDMDMAGPPVVFPLPMTREEAVRAAVEGIQRAWADGEPPKSQVCLTRTFILGAALSVCAMLVPPMYWQSACQKLSGVLERRQAPA